MQAPRYFLLLDNLFKKPDSKTLVNDLILTFSHRPHYYKLPPSCTYRSHRHRRLILSCFYPPAPSWWCLAPAMTYRKRYESSISSAIRVCRLSCLLNAELEKVKELCLQLPVLFGLDVFAV